MILKFATLILFTFIYYNHAKYVPEHLTATSQAVLDPGGMLTLKWEVLYDIKKIYFEIKISEKAPPFNWFALGFSERGELRDSDVCLAWTDYRGHDHFQDMHSDGDSKLLEDITQNCDSFRIDVDMRTISFERYFDTCDEDDYVIEDETVHVIWARGTDRLFTSNCLCLECTSPNDHGFIRVRLLTPPAFPKQEAQELRVTVSELKVPNADTTYWCKVVKLPDYVTKQEHHIIQFESTITKQNEGLVHHMEVFYCDADPKTNIPLYEGNCFSNNRPAPTQACSKVRAAWAMGAPPFVYPLEAGVRLGGPQANKFVMLEVHYNNPEQRDNFVDSSGIVLHITSKKRKYDAAIMELGLEYTDKMAIPGGVYEFPLKGYCVPQCTGVGLPENGIIVFGSQLHTHLTGTKVWTRHFRKGVELPILNKDTHYSTHFQEIRILHRPVTILPGDHLETTCIYRTIEKDEATIGGHAITDEMCVNYLHYYPATKLEVCKSAVSNAALQSYFKFEKEMDSMPISYTASPRANYISIKPWTPLRVEALDHLYRESDISMQCNKSDGTRFQGDWEGLSVPTIRKTLPPKERICPMTNNKK